MTIIISKTIYYYQKTNEINSDYPRPQKGQLYSTCLTSKLYVNEVAEVPTGPPKVSLI